MNFERKGGGERAHNVRSRRKLFLCSALCSHDQTCEMGEMNETEKGFAIITGHRKISTHSVSREYTVLADGRCGANTA